MLWGFSGHLQSENSLKLFVVFLQNAKERRSVPSWLHTRLESADLYLDCLQEIHTIFCDSADNSAHSTFGRDDYCAHEERIVTLIVRHEKCGYSSGEEFKKEMMNEQGRKSFQQRVRQIKVFVEFSWHCHKSLI
jgi:hypothetical protein